jgi:hypothetical protein
MATRRNMLEEKQWLKHNKFYKNSAFSQFSFQKLINPALEYGAMAVSFGKENSGFHKMPRISWLADWVLDSQKGLLVVALVAFRHCGDWSI